MHIHSIVALCLVVCCAHISAQNVNCDQIYNSCVQCSRSVPQRDDINQANACPRAVRNRWIWRRLTQCEVQRLYCRNPGRKFTCDSIAEMAKMRRRPLQRCNRCPTPRRTTRRPTRRRPRRTTRRPIRRTTRRRVTRRTTRRIIRRTTRRITRRTTRRPPPPTRRPAPPPTAPPTTRPTTPATTRRTTRRARIVPITRRSHQKPFRGVH